MIIVTGGAGFIGSNIVKAINKSMTNDVLVVDDLTNGHQFENLVEAQLIDYQDKDEFLQKIKNDSLFSSSTKIEAVFHQGACSTTTEWNGRYMMQNNYEYSKQVLHFCLEHRIPFIYASSAAIYGDTREFVESPSCERPLNVYGYSKLLFDQYVRRLLPKAESPIVGLRYFNVYGPGEQHKGSMASVAYHFNQQVQSTGKVKLFEGCDGYNDGEQQRDFVSVDDVVAVNLWFLQHREHSGIFNVGTGRAESFNAVAKAVINWHQRGEIEYIPFPPHLRNAYQSYTQASLDSLRKIKCDHRFKTVAEGVKDYLDRVNVGRVD